MSFLSSESIKRRLSSRIDPFEIDPFDPGRVEHGAYEMGLGKEAYTTDKDTSEIVGNNQSVVVKPGQMALLLTEEKLRIPDNIVGFISMKAGIKFRGLVNISGFHVDPGYIGHLKFSVYNAGTDTIQLKRGVPTFIIWFSKLDESTEDLYEGDHQDTDSLPPRDVMKIQGDIPSPNNLDERVKKLETRMYILIWLIITIIGSIAVVLGSAFRDIIMNYISTL